MTLHDEVRLGAPPPNPALRISTHTAHLPPPPLQVEIEDMEWSEELQAFTYQCPCGDLFQITLEELASGEEVARCPSCSLYVRVIYNPEDFADLQSA